MIKKPSHDNNTDCDSSCFSKKIGMFHYDKIIFQLAKEIAIMSTFKFLLVATIFMTTHFHIATYIYTIQLTFLPFKPKTTRAYPRLEKLFIVLSYYCRISIHHQQHVPL